MSSNKVFIIGGGADYARMFESMGWEVVNEIEMADALQFTGGADVDPDVYGAKAHHTTWANFDRDQREIKIFNRYVGKKAMLGICRGSQFLNVMSGGELFQDVNGHAIHGTHEAEAGTAVPLIYDVTSTHHQMMKPADNAIMLATAYGQSTRRTYYDKEIEEFVTDTHKFNDVEAVFYEDTNCLCFQPHPEFYGEDSCRELYFKLIEEFVNF